MKLSDKKLQELKKLKDKNSTSNVIENLYEKYLYTQKSGVEIENILKLLNENTCSFKDIVDKFKSIKDSDNDPCLYKLLKDKGLFEELIQNNKLIQDDLKYLLTRIDNIHEVANLSKDTTLLKHIVDIVSFKELVDTFKSIKGYIHDSCLYELLKNKELFKELIENNKLTQEDLKYLLDKLDKNYELDAFDSNSFLLKYIVDNKMLQELVDKYKSVKNYDDPCLHELFWRKDLFKDLIENNTLTTEDLRYLLNKIDHYYELRVLSYNTFLLKHIIDNGLFQELIDKFKSIEFKVDKPCLHELLKNKELFKNLIENDKLTSKDLKYLLTRIWSAEIQALCENIPLIKKVLNEFVLDKKIVERFNVLIARDEDIQDIFDYIKYYNNDQETLKLNESNKKIYKYHFILDEIQESQLAEILKYNEVAQNRLKEILDNNLESNYDFDQLIQYLKKPERKSILNI